jgi:hypothetical protein
MFVAILKAHWSKGFWSNKGGLEFPLALWTVAFAVGLAGPGAFSLDSLIGWPINQPLAFVIVAAVLTAALWVVVLTSKPLPTAPQQSPAQPTQPAAQPSSQPLSTSQPA